MLILVRFSSFSQETHQNNFGIAETEKISAAKTMNLAVNPNTLNYDVTYHKLEFTVDPAVYFITGKVTTTYTAISNMTSLTFDLSNTLIVSSVKINNSALVFSQNTNELVITLPTTQTAGTQATVEIIYAGAPPQNGFFAFTSSTHGTPPTPVMYTLSEPFGGRDWWPCKQDLNDKIDAIDVYITAPSQYVSVSNGIEPEAPIVIGGNKTTHFHHGYPIPAYLIAIAVTNYSVYNQTAGTAPNTFPIINYIYPETLASVETQLAQTPLIMDLFESLFEIYPFHNEKYGHAQFGWGGGMEHTTVSFMQNFSRGLIAHEMAHQWFGDKITCGTWKDIWLNEGFATYVAALVIENFDGASAFITEKGSMINNITSSPNGAVYLTDTQALDVNRIFSGRLTYNKGAMVLNMLRFKMGDALFFQGVKNYLADTNLAYKYAITSNLQSHLEAVYGSSLTEFFSDWIYNQGYPIYNITAQNLTGGQVKFVVNQTQSNASVSYFEMPVPVRVFGAGGEEMDLVLNNTANGQIFIENVPFAITSLTFDPEKNIISKNSVVTLGGNDFEFDTSVMLYPNPVSNVVSIDFSNNEFVANATFFNSIGQKIKETTTQKTWDVSSFESGIYFIRVATLEGTKQFKFIKK